MAGPVLAVHRKAGSPTGRDEGSGPYGVPETCAQNPRHRLMSWWGLMVHHFDNYTPNCWIDEVNGWWLEDREEGLREREGGMGVPHCKGGGSGLRRRREKLITVRLWVVVGGVPLPLGGTHYPPAIFTTNAHLSQRTFRFLSFFFPVT